MYAMKIPPGVLREKYGFMNWPDYNAELYETVRQAAIERISEDPPEIYASDISPNAIRKAKNNLSNAQIMDVVKCFTKDFLKSEKPASRGTLVMNPPYGERMNEDDNQAFYKEIGDQFKSEFDGWDCWIISSEMQALKSVGLRSSKRITLFNGPLECRLVKYEMYQGSRKD
jgi:putative N6-adenine-specific DNA methylase